MALTITYDGYGVVANADSLTNDSGGSGTGDWKELGGGSYSLSPDASKYGTTSIGSKYASKDGYTYIDGIAALDYSTGGAQEGEFIYIWVMMLSPTPLDTMANTPYNIVIGDGTGSLNEYSVASKTDSNGWDGRWRVFCIDPTITPTINGGADISAIDTIGVWIDTNVSVRAESFFISQIMSAKGLKVEGTSTTMYDDIIAWAEDYSNRAAGMFQSRGQTYFSLGSLTIHSDTANTTVSSTGSNVEYEKSEHWSGSAWVTSYPTDANVVKIDATGGNTANMTDTNVGLSGNSSNMASLNTSSATSFTKAGGYFKYVGTWDLTSNDSLDGVVITLSNSVVPNGAEMTNVTIGNTLESTTGAMDLVASGDLSNLSNITFASYSGKYALYIPASITGTITLNNFTGDGSGTDVYWAATSGALTINKSNGTNFSTWSAGGTATISLVTSVSIAVNVKDQATDNIQDAWVYIDTNPATGDTADIILTQTDSSGNISTSYSGAETSATVRIRKYGFKPYSGIISLLADSSTNITLITDPQQT